MTELVLKKIGKHFGVDSWLEGKNDYLVLNDAGRIIGRIVKRACSIFAGGLTPPANQTLPVGFCIVQWRN
jgi:hypothetical protein